MVAAHPNAITLCMAYYDNWQTLALQERALHDLPADLREALGWIVVDDGSPLPASPVIGARVREPPKRGGLGHGFKLFRMDVDIRWNQDACRNLAVTQATTRWVLLTDVDHVVPLATWRRLIFSRLNWKDAYSFARLSGPGLLKRNPHPNSWLLTRDLFERAGGYDERFAGYYGTDGDFRRRLQKVARIVPLPDALHEITPDMISDCQTTAYDRKTPDDQANIPRIIAERGTARPLRGRFPWHKVE